jgi:hypothetical protein
MRARATDSPRSNGAAVGAWGVQDQRSSSLRQAPLRDDLIPTGIPFAGSRQRCSTGSRGGEREPDACSYTLDCVNTTAPPFYFREGHTDLRLPLPERLVSLALSILLPELSLAGTPSTAGGVRALLRDRRRSRCGRGRAVRRCCGGPRASRNAGCVAGGRWGPLASARAHEAGGLQVGEHGGVI